MRITGGAWRGRRIRVVAGVRPSSATLREALVSRWLPWLDGAAVLDLYAGTGVVSLELLGRGAARSLAVESHRKVAEELAETVRSWDIQNLELRRAKLPGALDSLSGPFDLIFADPPYADLEKPGVVERLLAGVKAKLAPDGEFALEVRSELELPSRCGALTLSTRRRYGDSTLVVYRRSRPESRLAAG